MFFDRKLPVGQLGHSQQIERADKPPDLSTSSRIVEQLQEHVRAADRRHIVGHAEVGKFHGSYRTAPDPEQGQHHGKNARRAVADHDH